MTSSFTYNDVTIHANRDDVEEEVFTYIDEMADVEFFDTENIHIMPDVHVEPNSRTLIGFTMPFTDSLSPEIIGPDAGCGVAGARLENVSADQIPEDIISSVEKVVPLGRGEYSAPERTRDDGVHFRDEFPYETATDRLQTFKSNVSQDYEVISEFLEEGGYSFDWAMNEFIPRVGLDTDTVISGLGTLGDGNHFLEVGVDDENKVWVLGHSGSRKVGGQVFGYHNDIAKNHAVGLQYIDAFTDLGKDSKYLNFDPTETSPVDVFEWVTGGKGGSHIDKEQVREDYDGEEIQEAFDRLSPETERDIQWPVLTGEALGQYYIDMIFAQVYAEVNRKTMIELVCERIQDDVKFDEYIDNPHNLLSFKDGIIRKGAMSAGDSEKGIIPFNMDEGAVVVTGNGNTETNSSAPHGAGRVGSATEAREMFEAGNASEPSVLTNSTDTGEYPHAYKSSDNILPYIDSFATVETHIEPLYNIKA